MRFYGAADQKKVWTICEDIPPDGDALDIPRGGRFASFTPDGRYLAAESGIFESNEREVVVSTGETGRRRIAIHCRVGFRLAEKPAGRFRNAP